MKTNKPQKMTRRKFLKSAGSLGAGSLIAAGATASIPMSANAAKNAQGKTGYDYDVIVVGGGFAGVTAARDLQQKGYKTLLLEARNRLGGRTFTSEFAGHKIELGGSFVHWLQPHIWAEIQRYDLGIFEVPMLAAEKSMIKTDDGKIIEASEQDMIGVLEALNEMMAEAQQTWEQPFDSNYTWNEITKRDHLSMADRISQFKLNPVQKATIDSLFGTLAIGPLENAAYNEMMRVWALGNWNYPGFVGSVGKYKIKEGTKGLLDAMIKDGGFEIRTATPVKRVESRKDHALVTTHKGHTLSAAAVVSALPGNVIGDIEFVPALNKGKMAIFTEKNSGSNGAMFNAELKGDIGNICGMASSHQTLPYFGVYKQTPEHTIVTGFVTDADKLDMMDDEAIQDALREFIPGVEVLSSVSYDWINDPYSQGAYSVYKPNWIKNHFKDITTAEGRVQFAGTDFTEGCRSFMSGAIGSGIQAADRIDKMLA